MDNIFLTLLFVGAFIGLLVIGCFIAETIERIRYRIK